MKISKRELCIYLVSLAVLAMCLIIGFKLAAHRPLWNDEFYTQVADVESISYPKMFLGKIGEGNNTPLFYALQKGLQQLTRYKTPPQWMNGQWDWPDPYSQIFLRINPILFMSLSVVAIFFYFARFHSWLTALFSFFISLSSYMVWAYWVEARPYALWTFITTVQSLLFLRLVDNKGGDRRVWNSLVVTHFFLSFISIFGIFQMTLVTVLLWAAGQRDWRRYILLTAVPIMICLFYYKSAPHYQFFFDLEPNQLLRASFSRDRIYVLFIFLLYLGLYYSQKKFNFPKLYRNDSLVKGVPYLLLTIGMLSAAILVLLLFKLKECPPMKGFPVSNRYFIYLTPIGIISTTLLTVYLLKAFRDKRWMQAILLSGIGYLVVVRAIKTYELIKGFYGF